MLWSYNLEQQRWNYISPSVERLGGYSIDEAMTCPLDRFLTTESYQLFLEISTSRLEKFLKDESVAYMSRDKVEVICKGGTSIYVEISISPIRDRDGVISGFRGMARDITERVNFQQQLEYLSMHDQLTGLYNRNYFEEELRRLSKSRDYPITMISADVNDLKVINDTMGHEQGDLLLKAAADVLEDCLRGSDVLARMGGDEFTAVLPNTDEATADKVIKRIRSTIRKFSEEHQDLYLSLSLGVSTAYSPDVSFTELFKQADDAMYKDKFAPSARAKNKIMKGLMDALAEKDYLTEGHARRLGVVCRKVADKIGLSPRRLADLALLTQVHDLGKVGIPDQIIHKTGKLTLDEWKIMKQHPEKGYRIALSSNYMTNVASLILKHHENWDGSGYPLGLKDLEIPIECRIFSIADAFDTITSERPYNKAKSRDIALSEIKRCAGKQFDPDLVELFIEIMSKEQYKAD